MRLKPIYDGRCVKIPRKLPNGIGDLEEVGGLSSAAVVSRLVELGAFVYEADAGQVNVWLERKKRGSETGYWVAYKRHARQLHKVYICEAFALDPHNLDAAAVRLFDLLDRE